jgi:hypothetical protein
MAAAEGSGKAAKVSGAHEPDGEAGLARGRPRQKLRERNHIGIGALVEPASPHDELAAKVAEVCDRPAERGQAKLEKDTQDLEGRTLHRAHAFDAPAHASLDGDSDVGQDFFNLVGDFLYNRQPRSEGDDKTVAVQYDCGWMPGPAERVYARYPMHFHRGTAAGRGGLGSNAVAHAR